MRVAALYDIHGNLPALEAVLDEVREAGAAEILIGGDVVPGPMPRETMEYLRGLDMPVHYIRGNGDREVLLRMRGIETNAVPEPFREAMRWNARQLQPEDERALAAWPATHTLRIPGIGDVLFCHATPRSDTAIFTRLTSDERLFPIFGDLGVDLVVCGHTHMPFDRMIGRVRVVNAGSVGMPFGPTGADWLLLGPNVQRRQTAYDLAGAAERIRRTDYPQAEDFAGRNVLQPPSEAAMLEAFSKAELREGNE